MNIMSINNTPQFKGFSNIVSNTVYEENGTTFSYMAMKLNDKEKPDLKIWRDIQENLFQMKNPSDYIIFHTFSSDSLDVFSASDRALHLKDIKSSQDERLMLRAFDLIASLTRRISSRDFHPEDSSLYSVIAELYKNLAINFENIAFAEALTTEAVMKKVKHYKTAELINSQISKHMMNYFKL